MAAGSRAPSRKPNALLIQPAKALRGNLAISEYQEVLLRMNDENGKPVPTDVLITLRSATT